MQELLYFIGLIRFGRWMCVHGRTKKLRFIVSSYVLIGASQQYQCAHRLRWIT